MNILRRYFVFRNARQIKFLLLHCGFICLETITFPWMYYEQTVVPYKMLRDWCGWPHGRFPVWILNSPNHSVETEQLMRTVNVVAVVKQPGNIYVLLHTWVDITVVRSNIIFGTGISIETGSYSCFQLNPLCNVLLASYIRNHFLNSFFTCVLKCLDISKCCFICTHRQLTPVTLPVLPNIYKYQQN